MWWELVSCLICFEKCSVSCGPLKLRIWYKIGKSRDQWKRRHNYKSKQSQHINILLKVHLYLWALLLFLILFHDKEPARSDGKRGMATGRPWNTMWYHVIPDNTKQYQAITCNTRPYLPAVIVRGGWRLGGNPDKTSSTFSQACKQTIILCHCMNIESMD